MGKLIKDGGSISVGIAQGWRMKGVQHKKVGYFKMIDTSLHVSKMGHINVVIFNIFEAHTL